MSEDPVRHCPGCGQALRFPQGLGGMLMACPECGHRFASPFKLAGAPAAATSTAVSPAVVPPLAPPALTCDPTSAESALSAQKPAPKNTLAARAAARYASNS